MQRKKVREKNRARAQSWAHAKEKVKEKNQVRAQSRAHTTIPLSLHGVGRAPTPTPFLMPNGA